MDYMRITKCDLCKKSIKGDAVNAGVGFYSRAELCLSCGKPVLDFLKKHKFVEDETIKLRTLKKKLTH